MTRKAIALDIDGVILRGGQVLPGAKESVQRLIQEKIPFIFVTNGGGCLESEKANILSQKLGVQIREDQILQCHTPFRSLAAKYEHAPVLIMGKSNCINVAKSYGFRNVVDCNHIFDNSPGILPLRKSANLERQVLEPIEAVFIFDDPVDWTLDMQVLSDLLVSDTPQKTQRVPLFASNADIVYATDYPTPRFTQGAFVESFRHLFHLYHKIPLTVTYYGKPFDVQYQYAEEMLVKQSQALGYDTPLKFYGVGDNPKSDIKGANEAGDHWHSILVKTGLFPAHLENDEEHPANHVCDSIVEAIDYFLQQEV